MRVPTPVFLALVVVSAGVHEMASAQNQSSAEAEIAPEVGKAIQDLHHKDDQVRWKALEILAKLGPKAAPAVPTLIRALDNDYDRYRAITVLGAIGPAAAPAVPPLLGRLTDTLSVEDPYREEQTESMGIIETLAKIGPDADAAIPLLRNALKHRNSNVRYFAAYALGELGPNATVAIPDLEALQDDHEYVGLYVYPYGNNVGEVASRTLSKLRRTKTE